MSVGHKNGNGSDGEVVAAPASEGTVSWAHWALLITIPAMGLLFVALAWSSHREVADTSYAIALGQAELLLRSTNSVFRTADETDTANAVARALAEGESAGMRYLAIQRSRQEAAVESGQRVGPPTRIEEGRAEPTLTLEQGAIYRFVAELPPPRRPPRGPPPGRRPPPPERGLERQGPSSGPPPPPPEGLGPESRRPPPRREGPHDRAVVVFEFEATLLRDLAARTRRTLVSAVVAASLSTLASLLFWHFARERDRAVTELEKRKRLSALGEMSAVLAHEIRNPLASLKGHAQLLGEEVGGEAPAAGDKLLRRAKRIGTEASRLELLVNDLLDFSREGPIDKRPANLEQLLRECIEQVAPERVDLDLTDAPTSWPVDAERLRRVIVNILTNAVGLSPAEHKVSVRAATENQRLLISVIDSGPGISAEVAERLFEPFFTTRSQGSGLGLAVGQRIVELHGGTLEAQNHPRGGAEFRILLPSQG